MNNYLIDVPKYSKWKCHLTNDFVYNPQEGNEPNWFHRLMQYWILGFRWSKD